MLCPNAEVRKCMRGAGRTFTVDAKGYKVHTWQTLSEGEDSEWRCRAKPLVMMVKGTRKVVLIIAENPYRAHSQAWV